MELFRWDLLCNLTLRDFRVGPVKKNTLYLGLKCVFAFLFVAFGSFKGFCKKVPSGRVERLLVLGSGWKWFCRENCCTNIYSRQLSRYTLEIKIYNWNWDVWLCEIRENCQSTPIYGVNKPTINIIISKKLTSRV